MFPQSRPTIAVAHAEIMAVIRLENAHAARKVEVDDLKGKVSAQEAEISVHNAELVELMAQHEAYVAFEAEYVARELAEAALEEGE